jgi:hypothetical protein
MGLGAGATLALLAGGASVVAGIVTVIDNVAHDRPWDKNLVANMLLAGVLTWIGGKIAGHAGEKPSGTEPPGTEPPEQSHREQNHPEQNHLCVPR